MEIKYQEMDHIGSAMNLSVRQSRECHKGAAQELRQRRCRLGYQQEKGAIETDPTDKVSRITAMEGYHQGKAQGAWEVGS